MGQIPPSIERISSPYINEIMKYKRLNVLIYQKLQNTKLHNMTVIHTH